MKERGDISSYSIFLSTQVIDFLEHEISLKGDAEDERKSLLQAGRLNLAMCHLKMSQWIEARGVCDKVKIDGSLVMFCLC